MAEEKPGGRGRAVAGGKGRPRTVKDRERSKKQEAATFPYRATLFRISSESQTSGQTSTSRLDFTGLLENVHGFSVFGVQWAIDDRKVAELTSMISGRKTKANWFLAKIPLVKMWPFV
ncbi:uncharacterized protein LOC122568118 [Bombus pyrosoma]|uniref:uncharacterized protein LOC122568118 n=1 Tax=Bombus pyrosoma TaxID=396416 RepID=UPI001CB9220C|nr:uncharacterized protein LOC122568118 [Bombus pyrosoma]